MRGQAPKIAACQKASRKTCDYRWEWLGRRYFCSAALTCGPQERGYGLPAVPIRRDAVLAKVRSQQFGEWPVSASAGRFPALRLQQRGPAEWTQKAILAENFAQAKPAWDPRKV